MGAGISATISGKGSNLGRFMRSSGSAINFFVGVVLVKLLLLELVL